MDLEQQLDIPLSPIITEKPQQESLSFLSSTPSTPITTIDQPFLDVDFKTLKCDETLDSDEDVKIVSDPNKSFFLKSYNPPSYNKEPNNSQRKKRIDTNRDKDVSTYFDKKRKIQEPIKAEQILSSDNFWEKRLLEIQAENWDLKREQENMINKIKEMFMEMMVKEYCSIGHSNCVITCINIKNSKHLRDEPAVYCAHRMKCGHPICTKCIDLIKMKSMGQTLNTITCNHCVAILKTEQVPKDMLKPTRNYAIGDIIRGDFYDKVGDNLLWTNFYLEDNINPKALGKYNGQYCAFVPLVADKDVKSNGTPNIKNKSC